MHCTTRTTPSSSPVYIYLNHAFRILWSDPKPTIDLVIFATHRRQGKYINQEDATMPFQLPDASPTESVRFLARLQACPDEIKIMIIGRAVMHSERIDLNNFYRATQALIAPFASDKKLLAIAKEEVIKVNTFCVTGMNYQPQIRVHEIRHLVVNLPMQTEGTGTGPTLGTSGDLLTRADTSTLYSLETRFYRLQSLTIQVTDIGSISPGAFYTAPDGTQTMAQDFPEAVGYERALKLLQIDVLLKHLSGLERKLVLVQDPKARTIAVPEVPDLRSLPEQNVVMQALFHLLDHPRAFMRIT